jgi:hypothetical protein
MIKLAYTVFVSLLLTILLGVGIAAFYPAPEQPKPTVAPVVMSYPDNTWEVYNEARMAYNRNVSTIAIVFAVTFLVLGLYGMKWLPWLTDGFILGGVFSLGYSIVRSFESKDDVFRFLVVAASLGATLVVGQLRLAKVLKKH